MTTGAQSSETASAAAGREDRFWAAVCVAGGAALIAFALVQLDRRPVLAGILFGLLAYKPQFGLMIPLVLIATQRWRAFGLPRTAGAAKPSKPAS